MAVKSSEDGYGSVARGLHWGIAILVISLFVTGHFAGDTKDNAEKIFLLRAHVPLGISVLVLTLARIVWWLRADTKPGPLAGTSTMQTRLAKVAHVLLYIVPLGMIASGIGMMILTGAGAELFFKASGMLPDFNKVPPRFAHGIGAKVLLAIVGLHVIAATVHHFWMKDRTLRRMWRGGQEK